MKNFLFLIFSFAAVLSAQAQPVLFIKGANVDTPTLSVMNGATLNVFGGININQAGSAASANNNYLQNNGTVQLLPGGAGGTSDFINSVASLRTFTPGQTTGEIIFAANSQTQSITGGGTVEFMNLTVNNTLPPKVNLVQDVTVDGSLNVGGVINLQNNNLTLLSSGSLTGAPYSSGNMLVADETGQFFRVVNAGVASFLFPVGDSAPAYSPVTINFVSNTVGGKVGLNLRAVAHPQINNPNTATDYISRYWTFSDSGLTNYSYTGTFQYLPSDIHGTESKMKLSRWANPWYGHPGSSAASNTLTITSAITETLAPLSGDFTGRNLVCDLAAGTITSARDTICVGTTGNLTLTGNSDTTIQWQSSIDDITFTNEAGANKAAYKTPSLGQTTWFRAVVSNSTCNVISDTVKLYVPPALTASFFSTKTSDRQFTFNSDSSLGSIRSYHWDFGDGQTSAEKDPSHQFAKDTTYYVCLTIYDGSNCSYTFCRYLDITDAIPAVAAVGGWIVYPNPFGNELYVESKTLNAQIEQEEIYDVLGRRVLSSIIPDNSANPLKIDVSGLCEGVYLLKIKTTNADYVQRIIKQ